MGVANVEVMSQISRVFDGMMAGDMVRGDMVEGDWNVGSEKLDFTDTLSTWVRVKSRVRSFLNIF